jgi:hypothetical protein
MSHDVAEHGHKAAEHREHTAEHHKEAARHDEAGKRETAPHHVHLAHGDDQHPIDHTPEGTKVHIEYPLEAFQATEVPSKKIVTEEEFVKALARIASVQGANIGRV